MENKNQSRDKEKYNSKMGIGCGTSVISFAMMLILASSVLGIVFLIIFIISLIYGLIQYRKINTIRGKAFREQLPKGFDQYIVFYTLNTPNTFTVSRHFGHSETSKNPEAGDTCMCLNKTSHQIIFWHNNHFSYKYYLTSINYTPDIQMPAKSGKEQAIANVIKASRQKKVVFKPNTSDKNYNTNAYLQLITADFKHIRQIEITEVKAVDYNILTHDFMIGDNQLKQLEAKHDLI